jgi:hypothetical protein
MASSLDRKIMAQWIRVVTEWIIFRLPSKMQAEIKSINHRQNRNNAPIVIDDFDNWRGQSIKFTFHGQLLRVAQICAIRISNLLLILRQVGIAAGDIQENQALHNGGMNEGWL